MSFRFLLDKRSTMPPILTILIMVIIIGTGELIRFVIKGEEQDIPVSIMNVDMSGEEYIDDQLVIATLLQFKAVIISDGEEDGNFPIFIQNLVDYLRSTETNLDNREYQQLKQGLSDLEYIMKIEHDSDFSRMSIDGKAVAINIASRIYSLAGLELITDLDGNIQQILGPSQDKLYDNEQGEYIYNFQLIILVLTLCTIFTLILIIIIFVRKKNLFYKEEIYDEFDEKRYA